jgi:hypothetical protein
MKGHVARIFIAVALLGAIAASTVWAEDNTQITIIYSNDINGQIDSIG